MPGASVVKSVAVVNTRSLSGGRVKRFYSAVLTDINGVDRVYSLGPITTVIGDDGAAHAAGYLGGLKAQEIVEYKTAIRAGVNPFTGVSIWNSRAELLGDVLGDALTLSASDPLVLNGLPYLANVTDAEMIDLFGRDQAWVDNIRAQVASLLLSKTALDAYVPIGI